MSLGTAEGALRWPFEAGVLPADVQARLDDPERAGSRLFEVAIHWLLEDTEKRKALERQGLLRARGPAKTDTKDAVRFFESYDYGHGL